MSPSVSSACSWPAWDHRPFQIWQEDKSAPWSNDDLLSRLLLPSAGLVGPDWPTASSSPLYLSPSTDPNTAQHTHHQASCFFFLFVSFSFFLFPSFSFFSFFFCHFLFFPWILPDGTVCFDSTTTLLPHQAVLFPQTATLHAQPSPSQDGILVALLGYWVARLGRSPSLLPLWVSSLPSLTNTFLLGMSLTCL